MATAITTPMAITKAPITSMASLSQATALTTSCSAWWMLRSPSAAGGIKDFIGGTGDGYGASMPRRPAPSPAPTHRCHHQRLRCPRRFTPNCHGNATATCAPGSAPDRCRHRSGVFSMMNWNPALPVAHGNPEALVMALMTEQRLDVHFQAILDMTGGAVLGYEALVRCAPDSPFDGPEALFRAASAGERLEELNSHCLALALARFQALGLPGKLFLNTTPDSLLLVGELLAGTALAMQPGRVVLEVSEKYPFRDIAAIGERVGRARAQGIEVALDDLGAGYSGLKTWSLVRPD